MQTTRNRFLGSPEEIPKKIKGWNHTFQLAMPYIKGHGIGIDVGCREGGFAREMEDHFEHIHCFDFRDKQNMFKNNVLIDVGPSVKWREHVRPQKRTLGKFQPYRRYPNFMESNIQLNL